MATSDREVLCPRRGESPVGVLSGDMRAVWRKRRVICGLFVCLMSGGCMQPAQDRLLGRWAGRPILVSGRPDAPAETTAGELSRVEFELEFVDRRHFSMTFRDTQGRTDARSGSYRVTRVYGPRWEIELTVTDPPAHVDLELILEDDNRMTVHEVKGDSRLARFEFQRRADGRSSGSATVTASVDGV